MLKERGQKEGNWGSWICVDSQAKGDCLLRIVTAKRREEGKKGECCIGKFRVAPIKEVILILNQKTALPAWQGQVTAFCPSPTQREGRMAENYSLKILIYRCPREIQQYIFSSQQEMTIFFLQNEQPAPSEPRDQRKRRIAKYRKQFLCKITTRREIESSREWSPDWDKESECFSPEGREISSLPYFNFADIIQ